jgi:ferredoxin-2, mitochondrial
MLSEVLKSRILFGVGMCRQQQQQQHPAIQRRLLTRYQHHRLSLLQQPKSNTKLISARWHGDTSVPHDAPTVNVTFLQPDGTTRMTVPARIGESLLETAHRNEIDLEGACEGVCACSTCHLILPHAIYNTLPEASENEEDMLDMAFGLTETSRLGCQIKVTSEMEGIVLEMPKATRNFYVDGHKPKPH